MADLVCATRDIFTQAIHGMLVPSFTFEEGNVVLVGDSGCILRPHTAAGTTKAAINAWGLARCLKDAAYDVRSATMRYNEAMLEVGRRLVEVGV